MYLELLQDSDRMREETEKLRLSSPLYPGILLKAYLWRRDMAASTLVRIEREGKVYDIHCVQRTFISDNASKLLIAKINQDAWKIQESYVVSERDKPNEIQTEMNIMKIHLASALFWRDDRIKQLGTIHWFWRYLGFKKEFDFRVLGDPVEKDYGWEYPVKPLKVNLKWFKFILKTKDL